MTNKKDTDLREQVKTASKDELQGLHDMDCAIMRIYPMTEEKLKKHLEHKELIEEAWTKRFGERAWR